MKNLLTDIDELLTHLEDTVKGKDGDWITETRLKIQQALRQPNVRASLPEDGEVQNFIDKSEVKRTFQGTPCFAQERLAFDSGFRNCINWLREINKSTPDNKKDGEAELDKWIEEKRINAPTIMQPVLLVHDVREYLKRQWPLTTINRIQQLEN